MMPEKHPLVLLILDGWGYREETQYNAIAAAHTPQWDEWWKNYPHLLLEASGTPVGLPRSQMGNSEVGHMHIGAGRIISQDFTRINKAIKTGEFAQNEIFIKTIEEMKCKDKAIHVLGLLSSGGVHSHEEHLFAFLDVCVKHHFSKVYLHLFLDGRDTPPQSAAQSLLKLKEFLKKKPVAQICSITGRYFAMDRDKRWQRVQPLYRLLTEGQAENYYKTAEEALDAYYRENISDEFVPPTCIGAGKSIEDGDSILFFNFRADRARQLTQVFLDDHFKEFQRSKRPKLNSFVSMTQYAENLPTEIAFPPISLNNTLGEVISQHGLSQLRIAETEKYAHVTFFLNGGVEKAFLNEERILIPSPSVSTYDLQPEMSAPQMTKVIVEAIQNHTYDVIICNFANADMVGHTGNFSATVKAIESLDMAMHAIGEAIYQTGGQLLITADHGNAEAMFDDSTAQPHTAHTSQPVPFLYIGEGWHFENVRGSLTDIAPTLLTLLGIHPPPEMTGQVLLVKNHAS